VVEVPPSGILPASRHRAEYREAAVKYVMNLGSVDAVTIGFKSAAEIDAAIDRVNRVMNA
jgi:aryl-alcohol dehydrogenase-like predicted oxidoreductase